MGCAQFHLPPSLAHALPSKEDSLDAGTGFHKERGVPADIPQHEVLGQQVQRLPPRGPVGLHLVRLQRRLDQDQVAHLPRDGEDKEGVKDYGKVATHPFNPAKHVTGEAGHVFLNNWRTVCSVWFSTCYVDNA